MTTKIKVIKTEEDYQGALKMVEELMDKNPDTNSEDGEKLSLLITLVKDYESKSIPESLPDPIDAILFRMEQQNLKPSDLVPYIGSRSKVSEILSRKRPLTLSMIRSLEANLGIPAKVLLKESDEFRNAEDITWNRFPLNEMKKRGYFNDLPKITDIKVLMENFFQPIGSPMQLAGMLRKTNYRSTRPMDKHALIAWSAMIVKKANEIKSVKKFQKDTVNLDFMQKLAKLSAEENGPLLSRDFLEKHGIILIIEPHFPQTYLDGAALMLHGKNPIIGLTLRYDRIDNFWFNLMHELAHIALHYDDNSNFFYDDLENSDLSNTKENDADKLACEALVPENKWINSSARLISMPIAAESLAKELGIHIAIVAGKMRRGGDKYIYLNNIINQAKIRTYFPEISWKK
ncbi:MAG: ImmA/IrrE family metallo-endopeptidase [Candidatus Moraniibacteriota bacterium]